MYRSINQLESSVNKKIAGQRLDSALFEIQSFVEQVLLQPSSAGKVISSLELDKLCQQIGQCTFAKILKNEKPPVQSDLVVYLITQLYTAGGHTAVIEDLIRYQPNKKHHIIVTDLFSFHDRHAIERRFADFSVKYTYAPKVGLLKKLTWLQQQLFELQPSGTFLFNHHQDAVMIAAVQPNLVDKLYFFHHADHHLCLGVHLEHSIHIDAQVLGFHNCRHRWRLQNNIYWPLVVNDQGVRPKELLFMAENKLVTCTSGSAKKFETPYLYSYAELVPKILRNTGGKHIHIGPLSKSTLNKISQGLKDLNISPDSFVWIPWVKSLWQTLIEQRVDVYLNSFPISGGRAVIEAMGSGTPLVMHENYRSQYLGQVYMAYPESFCWIKPEELVHYLSQLTPNDLLKHSEYARNHYDHYYAPRLLEQVLCQPESMGLTPPPLREFQSNELQVFLEQNSELNLFNWYKNRCIRIIFSNPYLTLVARKMRKYFLTLLKNY